MSTNVDALVINHIDATLEAEGSCTANHALLCRLATVACAAVGDSGASLGAPLAPSSTPPLTRLASTTPADSMMQVPDATQPHGYLNPTLSPTLTNPGTIGPVHIALMAARTALPVSTTTGVVCPGRT